MRPVTQFAISRLDLIARGPARNHRDARAVTVRGAIEHVDEASMTRQRLGPAPRMQIELRKNMTAQSRQMNVDPVVAPVDQVGSKRMPLGVGGLERRVKRANVGA